MDSLASGFSLYLSSLRAPSTVSHRLFSNESALCKLKMALTGIFVILLLLNFHFYVFIHISWSVVSNVLNLYLLLCALLNLFMSVIFGLLSI